MFEFLRGIITDLTPAYAVLDVSGIGFQLFMANPYRLTDKMQEEKEVTIYVYQDVRQDAQLLYGFKNKMEKDLFLQLIKVSGIGPKSAMSILANEDHQGLAQAVENEDVDYLIQFPGVGKKTAGQLILDLNGKLDNIFFNNYESEDDIPDFISRPSRNRELEDAIEALHALGYGKRETSRIKKELEKMEAMETDAYLSQALSLLTKH